MLVVIENDDEEPTRQPEAEHSACGVGFVVRRDGARDHDTLKDALRALENLEHRGACAADGRSGDGAGVLTDIPYELLGIEPDSVALATIFVTDDPWVYQRAIDVFQVTLTVLIVSHRSECEYEVDVGFANGAQTKSRLE